MKKVFPWVAFAIGLLGFAPDSRAVEYIKICTTVNGVSLPKGFFYVPGSDSCYNPTNGELVQPKTTIDPVTFAVIAQGVWRTMMPYPRGQWVTNPAQACAQGQLVKIGDFQSTDFTPNTAFKLQAFNPVPLSLLATQQITQVIMKGGFYDPRQPARGGAGLELVLGSLPLRRDIGGLCLRSVDPSVSESQPNGPPVNPPFGDGGIPIGCIPNGRIVNMPAGYAIPATAAYPNIDAYFVNGNNQPPIGGPYQYGKSLVVTTDTGKVDAASFTYCNPDLGSCHGGDYNSTTGTFDPLGDGQVPLAGTLSVWVCVETRSQALNSKGNEQ